MVTENPYREPGIVESDEDRYRRAHTAYWAMMALSSMAFNALDDERKREYLAETERLRKILAELGPKLRWPIPSPYAARKENE